VDGEQILDPDNSSSVLCTALSSYNNEFEYEYLDEIVRLLNTNPMHKLKVDHIPVNSYSIPGPLGIKLLVPQDWAILFFSRRWGWDLDLPGVLVDSEMCLGKRLTSVAGVIICSVLNPKVVLRFQFAILWGKMHDKWVNLIKIDCPAMFCEKQHQYPLQRLNSVLHLLSVIPTIPPLGYETLTPALELKLWITMPGVAKIFRIVIYKMSSEHSFTLPNLFDV